MQIYKPGDIVNFKTRQGWEGVGLVEYCRGDDGCSITVTKLTENKESPLKIGNSYYWFTHRLSPGE